MKFIKDLPSYHCLSGSFAIYELPEETKHSTGKSYLVNRKYSEYAMNHMDEFDLIANAKKESEYVYGTGFCDTIRECELFFSCEALSILNQDLIKKLQKSRERINRLI